MFVALISWGCVEDGERPVEMVFCPDLAVVCARGTEEGRYTKVHGSGNESAFPERLHFSDV